MEKKPGGPHKEGSHPSGSEALGDMGMVNRAYGGVKSRKTTRSILIIGLAYQVVGVTQ